MTQQTHKPQRSFLVALAVGSGPVIVKSVVAAALACCIWQVMYALGWLTVIALYGRNARDLPSSIWMFAADSNQVLSIAGVFGLLVLALAVVAIGSVVVSSAIRGGWQPSQRVLKMWTSIHNLKPRNRINHDVLPPSRRES
jgi:hypothetical protein